MNFKTVKLNKDFLAVSGFGNVFICENASHDDKTITFPSGYNLELNISFKVVFVNGHSKANDSSHMTLNNVPVVINRYGTLIPIPNHNITGTVYDTLQPYTTLEMYYTNNYDGNDNPAFVVVGNPVVLSSADYTIYADGKIGNDEVGTVKAWSLAKVPYGWHDCDHSEVSRTIHSELFDSFRTQLSETGVTLLETYGIGDGETTFNLPDYRECALVGVGSNGTFITDTVNQAHDEYSIGEFKDDQMQNITGKVGHVNGGNSGSGTGAFKATATGDAASSSASNRYYDFVFNSWRVARTGYDSTGSLVGSDTTHGKQVGVKYIIKVL